jgi:hypothetical protein
MYKLQGMIAGGLLLFSAQATGRELPSPPPSQIALAREVAGTAGTTFDKTRRLVHWINSEIEWSATDYQWRSAEDIFVRRAGNRSELATVLRALLDGAGIRSRWVAEINIQPQSEQRQADAASQIAQWGNRGSVFGRMHDDRRWLEVYDQGSGSWFPADPAMGIVGIDGWVAARLAFSGRPTSPVAAVAESSDQMVVPFAVVAFDENVSSSVVNRSEYYLVEQFDRSYGNSLSRLPAWRDWVVLVGQLSEVGGSALSGKANLHTYACSIERLARVYNRLKLEELSGGADSWSAPQAASTQTPCRSRQLKAPRQLDL